MVRNFEFQETEIPGLAKICPFYADDMRGSLTKSYSEEVFRSRGYEYAVSEEVIIWNRAGVLRGLHFQRVKQPVKLVQCLSGHVWDVVVDLRPDSPSFKKWLSFHLDGEEGAELLIPSGCATGYLAFEDSAVICRYSEKFYPEYDGGIRWDDPELGVEWPLEAVGGLEKVILSDKDRNLQSFRAFVEAYGGL